MDFTGRRIAILGAYGAVGRQLLAEASHRGHLVTAVGRDARRLAATPADAHVVAAAGDRDAVRRIAADHDVVVNVSGVESPELVTAVTGSGAAVIDISAETGYLRALAAMPRPERPVLAGTGLAPGLTNLLADAAAGTGPLRIGIVAGIGEQHGAAAREWIWRNAAVYRTTHRFDIPGLGTRTLVRAAFGEQDQLAGGVTSWLGLEPSWATGVLRLAGAIPAAGPYLDRLSRPLARLMPSRDRWIVVVAAGDRTVGWATGRSRTVATAVVTALSIEPVLAAGPGVWAAHEVLALDDIRDELRRAGISTAL